ncbi:ABC transporter ATP-binding protein [Ancylobacter pratisalsi]|uniref:Spermidine/putrescine import ATP-binding protein PotA n=1 Tax=Ancylobacter pratisalsi TaxID=1745854 RepID=A0A6P1YNG6_9HYPH|nr:ABC transporter ATP-binding protein [Ancylobacter pratisalsi]QIB34997.1 ABC transporter ATP-binding protein [Ancylobacter pratisalsi]
MNPVKPADSAVEIVRVRKDYGGAVGVADVSLTVGRGEFVTLLGPSGCGKSTLLGMIAGFVTPTAGKIIVDGADVTNIEPFRRDIGMVFQSYALFPHMNVFDNVAFGLRMRKLPKAEVEAEVRRVIEMMKLGGMEDRRVRQLSGGQQQRVALARAIVIRPKVLLLDEPLSALDKNLRAQMQFELSDLHRKTGLTTIFVTHDQGEALSLSDRIVVMNRGEVHQVAAPIELYRTPANGFVASFIGEINALPAGRYEIDGEQMALALPGIGRLTAALRPELQFGHGTDVRAFLRPEHVVPAEGTEGANRVTGVVTAHVYQGSHTITRVAVEGIGLLETRVTGADIITTTPVGSTITLTLDLGRAVLLRNG